MLIDKATNKSENSLNKSLVYFACLSVCLCPINVKATEPIKLNIFGQLTWTQGWFMDALNNINLSIKNYIFVNFENPRKNMNIQKML